MNKRWVIDIALRNLSELRTQPPLLGTAKKVSMGALIFGSMVVLVVLSVVGGFQREYHRAILNFNAHVIVSRVESNFSSLTSLTQDLQKMPQVKGISSFVFKEGLTPTDLGLKTVVLKGVDVGQIEKVYPLKFSWIKKDFSSLRDLLRAQPESSKIPVLVGSQLFSDLKDKNVLSVYLGDNQQISTSHFDIVGTFQAGLYEFDSQFVLVARDKLNHLMGKPDMWDGLELRLEDAFQADEVASQIMGAWPDSVSVMTWKELNAPLFEALVLEKRVFTFLMFLLFMIGAVTLSGVIMMLVLHKNREASILKALGVANKDLGKIYFLSGFLWGARSVGIGCALALLLVGSLKKWNWISLDPQIYFVSSLPVSLSVWLWAGVVGGALVICFGVAYLATRYMTKTSSLRHSFE